MTSRQVLSRQTPIDDSYGTCERTCATLLIATGDRSPHGVSELLRIEPTELSIAGEVVVTTRGRPRARSRNYWFLSSEGVIASLDVRRHLDWLLGRIDGKAEEMLAIQAWEGSVLAVHCPWWSKAGHGGPAIWPEQMRRLAALNLELSFDVMFFGDEDEGSGRDES